MASESSVIRRSAARVVTKVRSALGSTRTTQTPVSRSATGGALTPTPSASSTSRTRSPFGPVPTAPASTASAPLRAAATTMVTEPPAYLVAESAMTLPPRSGRCPTSSTRSTIA